MSKPSPDDSLPRQLAELLSCDTDAQRLWNADDLAAMLEHQLSLPPSTDLRTADLDAAPSELSLHEQAARFANYLELLRDVDPPLALLERMKQLAKASVTHPDSPLPEEVGTALYFAAIAAGLVRCNKRLTRLDDQGLRWGLQWALDQSWLVKDLRTLLRQALEQLGT